MNFLTKLFNKTQGRTTAFTIGFFILGHVLQFLHRLDYPYVAFMTGLMGFVLGHSVKEDVAKKKEPPKGCEPKDFD